MEGAAEMVQAMNIVANVGDHAMNFAFQATGVISRTAMKVLALLGKGGIFVGQKVLDTKYNHTKLVSINKLKAKKGDDLRYVRIPEDKLEAFVNDFYKRGGKASLLRDLNLEDGLVELAYHVTDSPKMAATMSCFENVQEISFEDYINNANPETVDQAIDEINKEEVKAEQEHSLDNKENKKTPLPEKEKSAESFVKLNEKMNKEDEYTHITINKSTLVKDEDLNACITKIPGTKGTQFVAYRKEDVEKELDDGKTLLIRVKKDEKYAVMDSSGNLMRQEIGENLKKHYDEVKRKKAKKNKTIINQVQKKIAK